jgi:hypothetical protein
MQTNSDAINGTEINEIASQIREEYQQKQELFGCQPVIVQRYIESQARIIANALIEHLPRIHFSLPDNIVAFSPQLDQNVSMSVPAQAREQNVGSVRNRFLGKEVREKLRGKLTELEQSPDQAVATSAMLLRYSASIHMIYYLLPSGRSVRYRADDGEAIPTIPENKLEPDSAITAETDAIAEEGGATGNRGALQVPFVGAARQFFLPQWVAFDENGRLLVNTITEAEAHITSMQRFLRILFEARALAPYIISDSEFENKRYGMLGQLVNQGRALAHYKTEEIIRTIKERAAAGSLNRGLSISLPYFDDQNLIIALEQIQVIPAGRIMFVPAFVVRAVIEERAKISQDTRLNPSTRKHLLSELNLLESAFGQKHN